LLRVSKSVRSPASFMAVGSQMKSSVRLKESRGQRIGNKVEVCLDETGGDYYDYFRLTNGDFGVVLAADFLNDGVL